MPATWVDAAETGRGARLRSGRGSVAGDATDFDATETSAAQAQAPLREVAKAP